MDLCVLLLSKQARPALKNFSQKSGFELARENGVDFYNNFLFQYYGHEAVNALARLDLKRLRHVLAARDLHKLLLDEQYVVNDELKFNEVDTTTSDETRSLWTFKTIEKQDNLQV
jgi:hypothetical protein